LREPLFRPFVLEREDFDFEDDFEDDFADDFALEPERLFAFGFAAPWPSPYAAAASPSPRTAARLSSRAAMRSGALVGSGSSLGALTTSLP
jgi:hypothetical protein